jgi:putative membrane protein insertion efficiency factor
MQALLINAVRAYRYAISPLLGDNCRFYPSCSEYAVVAIARHGAVKGLWLAMRRLLRCHPWHHGGYDPVPGTGDSAEGTHEHG